MASVTPRRGFAELQLVGALVGIIAFGGALYGADRHGETRGRALQHADDQPALDKARDDIDRLHTDATAMIQQRAADNARIAALEAESTRHQEEAHAADQARTAAESRAAAAASAAGRMRLTVAIPASACRTGSGPAVPGGIGAASGSAATATVQLPAEIAKRVLSAGLDADELADAYRQCYRGWFPSWHEPVSAPVDDEPAGIFPTTDPQPGAPSQ